MSWSVYVLKCSDDTLYTGISTDMERRLTEHNQCNKKGARYTRARRPVVLVYQEFVDNRSEASKREAVIKKLSRLDKLALIKSCLTPA